MALEDVDSLPGLPAFTAELQAETSTEREISRLKSLREIFIRYSFGMDNFR
jgi:hypothetical protein